MLTTKSRNTLRGLTVFPIIFSLSCLGQCDLQVLDFDPIAGTVTVSFNSTEDCGGTGGPDGVSEIQFGFQAVDEDCNAMNVGWDFPSFDFSLSFTSNHPGWIYSSTTTELAGNWTNLYDDSLDPPYYTGDTVTFPVFNSYQSDCVDGPFAGQMGCNLENVIAYWYAEGYSVQAVIWQISYGQTMYASDGGWAEVGANGDGTPVGVGLYEDSNFQDNWVIVGDCGDPIPEVITDTVYIELPPDTVLITQYDTIYYPEICWIYDTVYIETTDTVYQVDVVYEIDTLYQIDTIPVPINWYFYDTTYIYITDTLYNYEYQVLNVDCETGLPCTIISEACPIYIPNSFTPNNDGINDVWGVETMNCWDSWSLSVYSRSGTLVWESYSHTDVWLGGDDYYVPDDVYVYRLECSMPGESYLINGHVTILR